MEDLKASDYEKFFFEAWRRTPANSFLTISYGFLLHGPLRRAEFEIALRRYVTEYHKDCLSVFQIKEGELVKSRRSAPSSVLNWVSFTDKQQFRNELAKPLDLEKGPIFRFLIMECGQNEYLWGCSFSHIIFDGLSFTPFAKFIARIYACPSAVTQENPLRFPHIKSVDRDFWRESLKSVRGDTIRVEDKCKIFLPRLPSISSTGPALFHQESLKIPLVGELNEFLAAGKTTLFQYVSAVTIAVLAKYMGETYSAIPLLHTVDASRTVMSSRGPGCATNLNPMYVPYAEADTPRGICRQIQSLREAARPHQHVPFGEILLDLEQLPVVVINHSPGLISVEPPVFEGLRSEVAWLPATSGIGELRLTFKMHEDNLLLDFTAPVDLLHREHLRELTQNWRKMSHFFSTQPESKFSLFEPYLISSTLRGPLLESTVSLGELLHRAFAQHSSRSALVVGEAKWTYAAVEQRVSAISQLVVLNLALPADKQLTVGIHLERSENLLFCVLATILLGVCFVPLDPAYPQERLETMAQIAGVSLILTDKRTLRKSNFGKNFSDKCLLVDSLEGVELKHAPTITELASDSSEPQYVLFTSGSTGAPKGVVISRNNLASFVVAMHAVGVCGQDDRLLAVTSLNFDISLLELLVPLVSGACVVIHPENVAADARQLIQMLELHQITVMQATPSTWRMLKECGWQNSSTNFRILVGGEKLDEHLAAYLVSHSCEVLHMYGPTETTIWSSCTRLSEPSAISIGEPISGTELYIMREDGTPCLLGVPGELWIGGRGVGSGYLNAGAEEKFIHHNGRRVFRTGDLVCHYGDGDLRFLRRIDQQTKVRGYRVELEEVNSQVRVVTGCQNVITVVRAEPEPHLVSFYQVAGADQGMEASQIVRRLRLVMPHYMVPEILVALSELPLTLNQKIDRKRLETTPLKELQASHGVAGCSIRAATSISPNRLVEDKIVSVLAETFALKLQHEELDLTWGEVGISSIGLNRLAHSIEQRFQISLAPHLFYQYLTPRKLGEFLDPSTKIDHPSHTFHRRSSVDEGAIAITGFSARLPLSDSSETFWENLMLGRNCVQAANRLCIPGDFRAGFLSGIDRFDAQFFQISPIEAMAMDPQQRLLLEEAVRAVEHSGYPMDGLGTSVGVYVAVTGHDYHSLLQGRAPSSPYLVPGISGALLANRISHFFNWHGPSLVVDTACSGSLIACVRAVRDLQAGLVDRALVAAVNLILDPFVWEGLRVGNFLSPNFRCATFDAAADGYVRGEGVGCLLLRRYEDALRDGDQCHGLIISSAENHGGRAQSLTAPNPEAQKNLLLAAYANRDIAAQLSAFEAHGTGTKLGDPIEVDALKGAWHAMGLRRSAHPVFLSSVKSHIGHLEPAAGIASLLKMLLCLKHKTLIGNLHFRSLNPYIQLDDSPFRVTSENMDWSSPSPRIAGISSFGFGGANAHIVLQEAPPRPTPEQVTMPAVLVCLSAKHPDSLAQMRRDLLTFLSTIPAGDPLYTMVNIAHTLQRGRSHFPYRWGWVGETKEGLLRSLEGQYQAVELTLKGECYLPLPPTAPESYRAELQNWLASYLDGYLPPWGKLYSPTSLPLPRVSLPTYRFHSQPYWFEQSDEPLHSSVVRNQALIWERKSTYHWKCVIPLEHVWLADHLVDQVAMLPGVAHLSMAWEAYGRSFPERAAPRGFADIRWLRPLRCLQSSLTCDILISTCGTSYQLVSEGFCSSSGIFLLEADFAEERHFTPPECKADETKETIYGHLTRRKLVYGPFFRGIQRIWRENDTCVAHLRLSGPKDPIKTNLLDMVFHSSVGVAGVGNGGPLLPFSCKQLIFSPSYFRTTETSFFAATQRLSPARVKIDVFQEEGRKILEIKDLGVREMKDYPEVVSYSHNICFTPQWVHSDYEWCENAALPTAALPTIVILYLPSSEQWARMCAERIDGAILVQYTGPEDITPFLLGGVEFWWIDGDGDMRLQHVELYHKAELFLGVIQLLGRQERFRLRLISRNGLTLGPEDPMIQPENSLLLGLAQTAAKEYHQGRIAIVVTPEITPRHIQLIMQEDAQNNPNLEPVLLKKNQRYVRNLTPFYHAPTSPSFQQRGTYLIIGGLGGLGKTIALHLAKKYQADLILVGRRSAADEELRIFQGLGGCILYEQCDILNEDALNRLFDNHSSIQGIIHSAIVLKDKSTAFMDRELLCDVLNPKVRGVISLTKVLLTREIKLDFILFFSSIQTFIANPGQANYTAACTFKDAMAQFLRCVHMIPTATVNWGYWGEVGIVATPIYQKRMRDLGIGSITPEEGINIVEQLSSLLVPQVAVLKATTTALARLNIKTEEEPLEENLLEEYDTLVPPYNPQDPNILENERAYQMLEQYSRSQAQRLPIPRNYLPAYQRLVEAVRNIPAADPISREHLLSLFPALTPHVKLLDRCLEHYEEVLTGKMDHMSVLFPNGSFDLVESIYSKNPAADYFNQTVASIVGALQKRKCSGSLRVFEVGAGTGSTTRCLLPHLKPTSLYAYTDLSIAFLRRAQEEFKLYNFMEYQLYNVEDNPPSPWIGAYDIVIATNVLHATKNVKRALENCLSLLRSGGVIIINEVTARQDYATLTFGLTTGWWLFEDQRIPGTPLLSPHSWHHLLTEVGFTRITSHGNQKQQVFVATAQDRKEINGNKETGGNEEQVYITLQASTEEMSRLQPSHKRDSTWITRLLQVTIGGVMRIDPDELSPQAPLANYGVDSLIVFEILRPLQEKFGELPATLFFEYPTIAQLASFLEQEFPQATEIGNERKPVLEPEGPNLATQAPPQPSTICGRDIAVVGMAGRFPGAASCTELWSMLLAGKHGITRVPRERWDPEMYTDMVYTDQGGFIKDVSCFDHAFFDITPRDAEKMDPQERIFLQEAYRALEDAGYTPDDLKGGNNGVFVGVMNGGYGWLGRDAGEPTDADSLYWSIANRVSYTLDWHGPSMAVDTACSSSLTALHIAVQSILHGDCSLALVGGVNLILHPQQYIKLCNLHMLSLTGKCHSFGAGADGFVDGEGVIAVLLKPYEAAVRDHDRIYGVIKASSLNSGGRSQGYTAPNPHAQQNLIRETLARAGVESESISYVEAHGTGTLLGDPIEVLALSKALRSKGTQSCPIGSLKTNLGHLESAAGLAGLTKVLLQLQQRTLVPSLHADHENPNIDFTQTPFYIQKEVSPWSRDAGLPRRALLNSFGAGGANASILVEEAEFGSTLTSHSRTSHSSGPFIVPFSAKDHASLFRFLIHFAGWIDTQGSVDFAALGYTLGVAREHYAARVCFVGNDIKELKEFLEERIRRPTTAAPSAETFASGPIVETYLQSGCPKEKFALGKEISLIYENGNTIPWGSIYLRRLVLSIPCYDFNPFHHWISSVGHGVPFEERYLEQHVIGGQPLLPAAFHLAKVLAANPAAKEIANISWLRPITSLQDAVTEYDSHRFSVCTRDGAECVKGDFNPSPNAHLRYPPFEDLMQEDGPYCSCLGQTFYAALQAAGYSYGPLYQRIQKIMWGKRTACALIDTQVLSASPIEAARLDACFQAVMALWIFNGRDNGTFIPYKLDRLSIRKPVSGMIHCIARVEPSVADEIKSTLYLFNSDTGELALLVEGLRSKAVGSDSQEDRGDERGIAMYKF